MPPVSVRKPKRRNFPTWRPHPKKPSSEPSWPSETVVLWREQSLRSLLKSPKSQKKLLQLQNPKQLPNQLQLQLQNQNQHQHQLPCSHVPRNQMMRKARTPKRRSLKILIRRLC